MKTNLSDYTKNASKGLLSPRYIAESIKSLKEDELEKRVITKSESLVICEVPKCPVKGDYWKCYIGNYINCPIYLTYLNKKQPLRHHRRRH